MSMKNSNDTIWDRTSDLPKCSTNKTKCVSQIRKAVVHIHIPSCHLSSFLLHFRYVLSTGFYIELQNTFFWPQNLLNFLSAPLTLSHKFSTNVTRSVFCSVCHRIIKITVSKDTCEFCDPTKKSFALLVKWSYRTVAKKNFQYATYHDVSKTLAIEWHRPWHRTLHSWNLHMTSASRTS
jgi:hypothetical protein